MALKIIDEATVISPSSRTAQFVLESDDPMEFMQREAADMVIDAAARGGLPNAGISERGPSAYPVNQDGSPLTEIKAGKASKFRMDFKLRASV